MSTDMMPVIGQPLRLYARLGSDNLSRVAQGQEQLSGLRESFTEPYYDRRTGNSDAVES